jgi:predicted HD superfamily hydrolase involved in NAD metabolism
MRESSSTLDSSLPRNTGSPQTACSSGQLLPSDKISPQTTRGQVLDWLHKNVPEARIQHILRVEQMAISLAHRHHLDQSQAAQAGLLHDLAKFFKPQRLLEMARGEGLELDPVDEVNPHLLHAEVGAIVARDEFGVQQPEILDAIRNHTLGRPGMSPLSCVVYLADSLEPGRGDSAELEHLRQISYQDLHKAVWLTSDYTLSYLLSSRHLIHPRAVLTRNWAMQASKRAEE